MNVYIRANRQLPQNFRSIDGRMIYVTELGPATKKKETLAYSLSSSPPTRPLKTSKLTVGSCGCGLQEVEHRQVISSFLASIIGGGPVEIWSENADEVCRTPEIVEVSASHIAELDFKFADSRTLVIVTI